MMSVPLLLSPHDTFPDPRYGIAHYDGLVAISMDLAPHRLLAAYQRGIFPWFSQDGGFFWFCTDPRAVLLPAKLHISKSLRKTLRNKPYRITVNHAFSTVSKPVPIFHAHNKQVRGLLPNFKPLTARYTA